MSKTIKLPSAGCELEGFAVVDMSTAHISKRDSEILTEFTDASPEKHPQVILSMEYGYFVSTWHNFIDSPEGFEEMLLKLGHSEAYINIVRLAFRANAKWVNFDQDGPTYEFLPSFDW